MRRSKPTLFERLRDAAPKLIAFLRDNRYWYAVRVAKADPIEALHGHYCGPGCWHYALRPDPAGWKRERGWMRWPSEIMAAYDKRHPRG